MKTKTQRAAKFRVGDRVSFLYGPRRVQADVIEDRGPIGVNGRRLFRVRLELVGTEASCFEIPEVNLEAAAVPDKEDLIRYLKSGGLAEILGANLEGGKEQPRAWLTLDSQGSVTHTFINHQGLIGGAAVPFFALYNDRIFAPRKEDVAVFLESFGLTPAEAEDVIRAVGTAP
jgi:hypothetical protein